MLQRSLRERFRASLTVVAVVCGGGVSPSIATTAPVARQEVQALLPERVVPAVSSTARGAIRLEATEDGRAVRYTVDYESLEGEIRGVQLRFGQPEGNGGVLAWLCGSPSSPGPGGTPACPGAPGRLEGELGAERIVGPAEQGVSPGQFSALLEALAAGLVYVQVESSRFESGELRGQLRLAVGADGSMRSR